MNSLESQNQEFLARAVLLFRTRRYAEAETVLRQLLAFDRENARALVWLARALFQQDKYEAALESVQQALHHEPNLADAHHVRAQVLFSMGQLEKALFAVEDALRREPTNAEHWSLLALFQLERRDWNGVLAAAEQGLMIDPEHLRCLNFRAMALRNLGRRDEAAQVMEGVLAREPENPLSRANQGWLLLEQGKIGEALTHFREALRGDPSSDWARSGVVAALKARNPLYAGFLGYKTWSSRLSGVQRWVLLFGLYGAVRIARTLWRFNPDWGWIMGIFLIPYMFFALFTWIADPLFNLLLWFDPFGRMTLFHEDRVSAAAAAGCLGGGVLLGLLGLVTGQAAWWGGAVGSVALLVPIGGIFKISRAGWRNIMIAYTALLAFMIPPGIVLALLGSVLYWAPLAVFLVGWVASTWIVNLLMD